MPDLEALAAYRREIAEATDLTDQDRHALLTAIDAVARGEEATAASARDVPLREAVARHRPHVVEHILPHSRRLLLRWPAGRVEGGQFRPRRGGVAHPVKRGLRALGRLGPESPGTRRGGSNAERFAPAVPDRPGVMYHVAPRSARATILKQGLLGTLDKEGSGNVYLDLELPDRDYLDEDMDIWVVDSTGLEVVPDESVRGLGYDAWKAYHGDVGPERLTLIGDEKAYAEEWERILAARGAQTPGTPPAEGPGAMTQPNRPLRSGAPPRAAEGPQTPGTEEPPRFPTVQEILREPAANYDEYSPLDSDGDWLMSGGCVALAIAMKEVWPDGKIMVGWYNDHGEPAISHAVFYVPGIGAWDGTGFHESPHVAVSGNYNERIDEDADVAEIAAHMGIDYDPEQPFASNQIMDAWMFAERWFVPEWARNPDHDEDVPDDYEGAESPGTPDDRLSLAAYISVAEDVMERAGLDGGVLTVTQGHPHHPTAEGRAESERLSTLAREITGDPKVTVHVSDWIDGPDGKQGIAAYHRIYNVVAIRPGASKLTLLHELAHVMTDTDDDDPHSPTFARLARDLYAEHISPEAGDQFWRLVSFHMPEGAASPGTPRELKAGDKVYVALDRGVLHGVVEKIRLSGTGGRRGLGARRHQQAVVLFEDGERQSFDAANLALLDQEARAAGEGAQTPGARPVRLHDPLPPPKPGHVRLYLGTSNEGLRVAREQGYFGLRDHHLLANQIEQEYGLPLDSVWENDRYEYVRSTRARDTRVYTTDDLENATYYAGALNESTVDALKAAHRILYDDLLRQIDAEQDTATPERASALSTQWKEHERGFIADWRAKHLKLRPVIAALDVPLSQFPVPEHVRERFTPESYYEAVTQGGTVKAHEVPFVERLDASYIVGELDPATLQPEGAASPGTEPSLPPYAGEHAPPGYEAVHDKIAAAVEAYDKRMTAWVMSFERDTGEEEPSPREALVRLGSGVSVEYLRPASGTDQEPLFLVRGANGHYSRTAHSLTSAAWLAAEAIEDRKGRQRLARQQGKRTYAEAQTIEELQTIARARMPHQIVNIRDGDLDLMRGMLQQADTMFETFPLLRREIGGFEVDETGPMTFAKAQHGLITFSHGFFGDRDHLASLGSEAAQLRYQRDHFQESMTDAERSSWHPLGAAEPAAIVTHELAHVLDDALSHSKYRRDWANFLREHDRRFSRKSSEDVIVFGEDDKVYDARFHPSRYASTHIREGVSEGLVEILHSPYGPESQFAIALDSWLREHGFPIQTRPERGGAPSPEGAASPGTRRAPGVPLHERIDIHEALDEDEAQLREMGMPLPEKHIANIRTAVTEVAETVDAPAETPPVLVLLDDLSEASETEGSYTLGRTEIGTNEDTGETVGLLRLAFQGRPTSARATTVHELGHVLDAGLGGGEESFASSRRKDAVALRRAWKASETYQIITGARKNAKEAGDANAVEMFDYLLSPEELFARAFAQWVSMKTNDALLRAFLQIERRDGGPWHAWDEEEFRPIAAAIDEMFAKRGLLKLTESVEPLEDDDIQVALALFMATMNEEEQAREEAQRAADEA